MTSQTTLSIKGIEFNVLSFNYPFNREINQAGLPGSDVKGGRITITVQAKKAKTELLAAIIYKEKDIEGTISVKEADGLTTLKEYNFSEGYVINYEETFDSNGKGLCETFTVSANKLSVNDVTYGAEWATA